VFAFGRLAPGVTMTQARDELATLSASLAREFPAVQEGWRVTVVGLRDSFIPPDVSLVIWIMMAAATLVLFIACSNVANLLLARATSRRREISVRVALGAGRAQILRQLLTESVVLALAAVPFGVLMARAGSQAVHASMPVDQVPYYITWSVDARALLYTLAIAVSTAVVFGLLPALQVTGGNLHDALKEGTRGNSVRRSLLRSSLVVTQVSLALVALVGALLFVRTFLNLNAFDVGFDTRPLMTMRFYLPGEPYQPEDAKARRVQDIIERVERLPGVTAAFSSNMVPVSGGGGGGGLIIDGRPTESGREPGINFTGVTPGFLRTLGAEVTRGRDFTPAEGWSRAPVALISEAMAALHWPDGDPVGSRFRLASSGTSEDWFTIIGVAPDIQQDDVDPGDLPQPTAYVPYMYQQTLNTGLTIRVAAGAPAAITSSVREQIRQADPNLPVFAVRTMDEVRRIGFWQFGLFGWIFGAIGLGGLILAAIGVYGVLSYAVSQRTQEIGVRVALGASRRAVLRLIVGHGVTLAGIGIVVGVLMGLGLMPLAQSFFYNVSPFDPLSFAAVSVFLGLVAVLASWWPALRATRVDPMVALRGE
jgi:predicted permease